MRKRLGDPRSKQQDPPTIGKNLDISAHLQYIRDQLTDHENDLLSSLKEQECEI